MISIDRMSLNFFVIPKHVFVRDIIEERKPSPCAPLDLCGLAIMQSGNRGIERVLP